MSSHPPGHGHPPGKLLDLDAPLSPGAVPGLGIGDVLRWLPVVEELIAGVKSALASGSFTLPALHISVFGAKFTLGPVPITKTP